MQAGSDERRKALWEKRKAMEERRENADYLQKRPFLGWMYDTSVFSLFEPLLRVTGLLGRGLRNLERPVLAPVSFEVAGLPAAFDGFRILQISDMHFRLGHEGHAAIMRDLVNDTETDLCVLTGDYRFEHHGPFEHVIAGLRTVLSGVHARHGVIAILGNHDRTPFAEPMRALGMTLLINEHAVIEQNGERLWVAGVDDRHHFQCHDLTLTLESIPEDACTLLLAHSPELVGQAAARGVAVYLCGHTHWGQVRIPGLGAVYLNTNAPRRFCTGEWEHHGMKGYTTAGLGATDVPVRFNCTPSAGVIELRRPST